MTKQTQNMEVMVEELFNETSNEVIVEAAETTESAQAQQAQQAQRKPRKPKRRSLLSSLVAREVLAHAILRKPLSELRKAQRVLLKAFVDQGYLEPNGDHFVLTEHGVKQILKLKRPSRFAKRKQMTEVEILNKILNL